MIESVDFDMVAKVFHQLPALRGAPSTWTVLALPKASLRSKTEGKQSHKSFTAKLNNHPESQLKLTNSHIPCDDQLKN